MGLLPHGPQRLHGGVKRTPAAGRHLPRQLQHGHQRRVGPQQHAVAVEPAQGAARVKQAHLLLDMPQQGHGGVQRVLKPRRIGMRGPQPQVPKPSKARSRHTRSARAGSANAWPAKPLAVALAVAAPSAQRNQWRRAGLIAPPRWG